MGSRPKGLALIINIWRFQGNVHPLREGADVDSKNLMELFKQLGYETELHEDLTRAVSVLYTLVYNHLNAQPI